MERGISLPFGSKGQWALVVFVVPGLPREVVTANARVSCVAVLLCSHPLRPQVHETLMADVRKVSTRQDSVACVSAFRQRCVRVAWLHSGRRRVSALLR